VVKPLTGRRLLLICAALAGVLVLVSVAAVSFGVVPIPTGDLLLTLVRRAIGESGPLSAVNEQIVLETRLPRVVLGMLVGGALAVAGAGFQALLRNPLADPYVLGVSSGAALGAIASLALAPQMKVAMPLAAFVGAMVTISGVYLLGRRAGQLDSYTLLLAGIITASFLSAVIMFLMTTLPTGDLRGMAFWLMGDLSIKPPVELSRLYAVAGIAFIAIYFAGADLNLLLTGEQEARHLGVNVARVKLVVYLAASLLTGLAVSLAGAIGYVGLLVPHVMRLLVGSDYRMLLPAAALGGAITVVLADTLARTVVAPTELPVGAMTALVGAPVFLFLLRRRLR
jgi:iron complex transport system permease protein